MNQKTNPFALPGFGQTGELSQNPLLASMEMMSQAWHNLASTGMLTQPPVSAALATEDLDRRINDLRAVENWLRMNMSMLASSIQALEVQRATIATIKSFANVPGAPADSHDNPSPLEVALGIKPSGQAKIKTPAQAHGHPSASSSDAGQPEARSPVASPDLQAMSDVAEGWWNMLQNQFDAMAAMTAAGIQASQAAQDIAQSAPGQTPATHAAAPASSKSSATKAGAKRAATKAAKKAADKSVRKRATG